MIIEEKRIEIEKKGPYRVYGNIKLDKVFILPDLNYEKKKINSKWGTPKHISTENNYSLCRCGKTKDAPFCDYTHANIHWDSKETSKKDEILKTSKEYIGKNMIMLDKPELCFGAGFCYSRKGNIWEFVESKDEKNDVTIKQMAKDCPAGRFTLIDKKTKNVISPSFPKSISIIEETRKKVSGPIWVKGKIQILSQEECYEKRDSVTLCRCGESNNKPFCDGTHSIVKWSDGDKSLERK